MAGDCSSIFRDEDKAYAFVEAVVWPDGPICPHCGETSHIGRLRGESRPHSYKCYRCRKPFTVKAGTLFEASNLPMHKWLQALALLRADDDEPTTAELSRVLGVTFKTASALLSRIKDAEKRRGDDDNS